MCHPIIQPQNSADYLDVAFKSATICIALFNVYFASKVFRIKNKKDDSEKERDRKIQLLKTLVLDHSLKFFYSDFEGIENKLIELKAPELSDEQKSDIDTCVCDILIGLRRHFYDSLLAIDSSLYDTIVNYTDDLQEHISNAIFDPGIKLSYGPKYDEIINEKIIQTKTNILRVLFNYRGD